MCVASFVNQIKIHVPITAVRRQNQLPYKILLQFSAGTGTETVKPEKETKTKMLIFWLLDWSFLCWNCYQSYPYNHSLFSPRLPFYQLSAIQVTWSTEVKSTFTNIIWLKIAEQDVKTPPDYVIQCSSVHSMMQWNLLGILT